MRYRKIYDVIGKYPGVYVNDRSYWRLGQQGYIGYTHPLDVFLEVPKAGLRIWVNHEYGKYTISTADMTFPTSSQEYYRSFRRYKCHSQTEMAETLEHLLHEEDGRKLERNI